MGLRECRDIDAGELSYMLSDHLGSVVAVTDDTGAVLSDQRFLPFGAGRENPGVTETDFGYTGQRNNPSIGMMDYNARWYSPSLSRFTQPDTIVPSFSNPQSLNRYSYVSNNPINSIDPSGHKEEGACGVADTCTDDVEADPVILGDSQEDPSDLPGNGDEDLGGDDEESPQPTLCDIFPYLEICHTEYRLEVEFWPFASSPYNVIGIEYHDYLDEAGITIEDVYTAAVLCVDLQTSEACNNPFWDKLSDVGPHVNTIVHDTVVNSAQKSFEFFISALHDSSDPEKVGPDPLLQENYEAWWLFALMNASPNARFVAKGELRFYIEEKDLRLQP